MTSRRRNQAGVDDAGPKPEFHSSVRCSTGATPATRHADYANLRQVLAGTWILYAETKRRLIEGG